MRRRLLWGFAAQHTLRRQLPEVARQIDRAALLFAETGDDELRCEPPYHYLPVGRYELELAITDETVTVLHVHRARRG